MPVFGEGAQPEDGAVGVGNVECPAQAVLSDGRVRHPELVEPGAPALERCALVVTMLESCGADEDMRQLADWGFRRSREDAGRVCAALEEAGLLRPGRDAAAVADELHVLCSPQVH